MKYDLTVLGTENRNTVLPWYLVTIPERIAIGMECYSAIKGNLLESVLMRWMNLESVIQSEVSQKEKKQISSINACVWNLERWYW